MRRTPAADHPILPSASGKILADPRAWRDLAASFQASLSRQRRRSVPQTAPQLLVCRLDRVSPLAVPELREIGRQEVYGSALDPLLDGAAPALIDEATSNPAVASPRKTESPLLSSWKKSYAPDRTMKP